jgi:hypothetical protein
MASAARRTGDYEVQAIAEAGRRIHQLMAREDNDRHLR